MRMSMILVKNKQILTLAVVMAIADSIALTNNIDIITLGNCILFTAYTCSVSRIYFVVCSY